MAANKTIGGINVTITAGIQNFAKNITKARSIAGGFTKTLKGLTFNLKTLGAALAVGGVTKLVSDQMQAIATMKDLADKTGINVEKIAGLELAAREAGVSMSVMEKSLVKLNSTGEQGDVALRNWIEKTAKLTTAQERLAAATEMFGSKGSDMVRLVAGGVAAFDEAQKAAEMSGLAISAATAMGVDRALESYERLKDNVTGIFRTMAAESWPYLQGLVDKTNAFINSNGGGKGMGTFITDVLSHMAGTVVDLVQKMVAGVLRGMAGVLDLVNQFRSSKVAGQMGLSVPTEEDFSRVGAMRNRAAWLEHSKNMPSNRIRQFVEDARSQAEQAAKSAALSGPGILETLFGDAKKYAMGSGQSWKGAGMGLFGMMSGQLQKMSMAAGAFKSPAIGQRPSLAFAESGSVESYRQQAAIRRGNEDVGKKQLRVQENMLEALKEIKQGGVGLAPANFGF